jgi:hypothetical protein
MCYYQSEVKFMPKKEVKKEQNGFHPRASDYANPKILTKDEKAALDAFREAMKALKEEERKYGKKTYF